MAQLFLKLNRMHALSEQTRIRDFFISFANADREWATWIAWTLEEAGYSVWFQDWDFKGNFVLEMDRAHTCSRRTIAVLSPDYLKSRFAAPEWAARFAQDSTSEHDLLVPVRVSDFQPTGLLAPIVYVDLVGIDEDSARRRLLERVSGIRTKPGEPPIYPTAPNHTEISEEPRFPVTIQSTGTVTIQAQRDVTHTGTIIGQQTIQGVPFEEYKAILAERDITASTLGVTDTALTAFFGILGRERVPHQELETTLKEIASRYKDLLARLATTSKTVDPEVIKLKGAAREAVEAGYFENAERHLEAAKTVDLAASERGEADSDARKLSAAETAHEAGGLQMAQLAYAKAIDCYEEAVALLPASASDERGAYLVDLGRAAMEAGQYSKAATAFEDALALAEKRLAPDDRLVVVRLWDLAGFYLKTGRYDDAEPLYKRALEIDEKNLGSDHYDIAPSLLGLASLYIRTGRYDEAEPLCRRELELTERTVGPDDVGVARSLSMLASVYTNSGRYDEAEPLLKRAIAIIEKALGHDHPDLAGYLTSLANLYKKSGRYNEAEPFCKRGLALTEKAVGPDHPDLALYLSNLANLYRNPGRYHDGGTALQVRYYDY